MSQEFVMMFMDFLGRPICLTAEGWLQSYATPMGSINIEIYFSLFFIDIHATIAGLVENMSKEPEIS